MLLVCLSLLAVLCKCTGAQQQRHLLWFVPSDAAPAFTCATRLAALTPT
jgi:hypothetical protein